MKLLHFLASVILVSGVLNCRHKSAGAFFYISAPTPLEFESNGLQKTADLQLWIKDHNSKKKKLLGKLSQGATDICFSSDGKFLVFSSNTQSPGAIYSAPTSGGRPDQLTDGETLVASPVLSPDNKKIVYSSFDNEEKWNIHLMNVDGSRHFKLTNSNAIESFPAWSSDGKKILFHKKENDDSWHIYSIDINGENITQLTQGHAMDWLPCASPDGKHIAFWSTRIPNHWEIFLMNTDGNNIRQISNDAMEWYADANICQVAWTPDSKKIIFSAPGKSKTSRLMELEVATGKCHQISNEEEYYCYAPVWLNAKAKAELTKNGAMIVTPTSASFAKKLTANNL